MGRKLQIAAVIGVALLIVCAVGAYAWDSSQKDTIASGVKIGGIDVGELSDDEAKGEIQESLVEPLDKPVTVSHEGAKYVLKPDRLGLRADVDGMVDQAIAASREAALPSRLWRYATGGEVDRSIRPRIDYSEEELTDFIAKIEADVNSEPQDASVEPGPSSLNLVGAQPGYTLRTEELREAVEGAIQNPDQRKVTAQVDEVQPEVTKDDLASQYPTYLTLNRSTFELRFWRDLKLQKTYTVAVGAQGFDTPAGVYGIESKQVNPTWYVPDRAWAGELAGTTVPPGPENPLKARFMGIFAGAGIHGTDDLGSLGTAASHGCVRMSVPDVVELYDQVEVGTPIYIG
jgi:lipoprotein-anchoring transpeptidase ErfK/SrfK